MKLPPRFSLGALLGCTALIVATALGQSLSIIRMGGSKVRVEAEVPADTRYVLQVSDDLKIWTDINDQLRGWVSSKFDLADTKERFFRLIPWTPPPPPITLVLLGDSTVMDGCGWGQGLPGYFTPAVTVVNLAWPALSTSGFLASEQLTKMLAIKPDFVLVQFGLVAEPACVGDPHHCPTPLQVFAANLKVIVETIRDFNGTPIVVTPPGRRLFDDAGRVIHLLGDCCGVASTVAAEFQIHLLDLNQSCRDLYNELGADGSAYITWSDRVHFTPEGANVIGGLVAKALPNALRPYLAKTTDQQE